MHFRFPHFSRFVSVLNCECAEAGPLCFSRGRLYAVNMFHASPETFAKEKSRAPRCCIPCFPHLSLSLSLSYNLRSRSLSSRFSRQPSSTFRAPLCLRLFNLPPFSFPATLTATPYLPQKSLSGVPSFSQNLQPPFFLRFRSTLSSLPYFSFHEHSALLSASFLLPLSFISSPSSWTLCPGCARRRRYHPLVLSHSLPRSRARGVYTAFNPDSGPATQDAGSHATRTPSSLLSARRAPSDCLKANCDRRSEFGNSIRSFPRSWLHAENTGKPARREEGQEHRGWGGQWAEENMSGF